jgi:mRNA interferase RelE/StbE
MAHRVLTETVVSISEHKKNPMATLAAGEGMAVAVLNRNEPAFYCVPAWSRCGSASMLFELAFHPEALREWRKLTPGIREQFKNKLAGRLTEARIPARKLRGSSNRTKIKLRAAGYRLVYEVRDHELLVLVVAVGKRERMLSTSMPISAEAVRRTRPRASRHA